jgi:hypothetical protein
MRVASARSSEWSYDMTECPPLHKCLLLTESKVAVIGMITAGTDGYIAWAPLPKRDKDKERELGIL